jgi:hypothetical protein
MTTPNGYPNPDVAYVWGPGVGYGQDITEQSALALMRGQTLNGYEDAQDSWKHLESDVADLSNQIRDAQLDLEDRIDLLEGVTGYCNTFMSKSWSVASQTRLVLPFDTQLGPSVGASPYEGGIKLDTKGLWRADTLVTFPQTSGGKFSAGIYLTVRNLGLEPIYSESLYAIVVTDGGPATVAFSKTFVIPSDNTYMVTADVWQGTTVRIPVHGGTQWSALSVNKWSNNTDNNVDMPTVPDGGELG